MKHSLSLGILLVAGYLASPNAVSAADVPSKKSEPRDVSPQQATPSAPSVEKNATRPKSAEPLKWDQLDPKVLEKSTKAQPKSPFNAVPPER
jgi:hypothetical protein